MALGLSCSAACGIFLDLGSNLCPLHWQADSQPLRPLGSPSLLLLNQFNDSSFNFSLIFFSDSLSAPLLVLTMWLLPLILIASQSHLLKEPLIRKKLYMTILIILQTFLIITFTTTELMLFYIIFEATLVPTLIIITC